MRRQSINAAAFMGKVAITMATIVLLLLNTPVTADTLELTNGSRIEGTFVDRADGMVRFEVDGIVTAYSEKDVKNVTLGAAGGTAGNATPTETAAT